MTIFFVHEHKRSTPTQTQVADTTLNGYGRHFRCICIAPYRDYFTFVVAQVIVAVARPGLFGSRKQKIAKRQVEQVGLLLRGENGKRFSPRDNRPRSVHRLPTAWNETQTWHNVCAVGVVLSSSSAYSVWYGEFKTIPFMNVCEQRTADHIVCVRLGQH